MSDAPIVLIAASGHARVIVEIAGLCGRRVVALFDDDPRRSGSVVDGVPIKAGTAAAPTFAAAQGAEILIAVGSPTVRATLFSRLPDGLAYATLVHPAACISTRAKLGPGTVVMAQAAVNPGARIGAHCVINTGASVDHDVEVGDFVHIAPGARVCGGVKIGARTLIGAGAVAIPLVNIGSRCVIGAGAAVTRDIRDGATAVGVPARIIKE